MYAGFPAVFYSRAGHPPLKYRPPSLTLYAGSTKQFPEVNSDIAEIGCKVIQQSLSICRLLLPLATLLM